MTPHLKYLALALAVSAISIVAAGGSPSSALAQTATTSEAASFPAATVKALQEALNRQGIPATVDGVLGDATRAAIRQFQSQHHLPVTGDPDRATLDKLGVVAPRAAGPKDSPVGEGAPSSGMMGQGMKGRGMMGGMAARGTPPGGMGMGMMAQQGAMPMAGGMTACPMMQTMMQGQSGDGPGAMRGATGMGIGPGTLYGMVSEPFEEMTPERVRAWLEQRLAELANPRLKIGEIVSGEGEITAEIVTVDGSLVQKLAFNRHPGFVRAVQ